MPGRWFPPLLLAVILLVACGLTKPVLVSVADSVNQPLQVTIYKAPS